MRKNYTSSQLQLWQKGKLWCSQTATVMLPGHDFLMIYQGRVFPTTIYFTQILTSLITQIWSSISWALGELTDIIVQQFIVGKTKIRQIIFFISCFADVELLKPDSSSSNCSHQYYNFTPTLHSKRPSFFFWSFVILKGNEGRLFNLKHFLLFESLFKKIFCFLFSFFFWKKPKF